MITSSHNAKIQLVRSLLGRRQAREEAHAFVIEGVRLAEEALSAGCRPQLVLHSADLSPRGLAALDEFRRSGADLEEVDARLLASLSATETSQGLLAVLPELSLALPEKPDFLVIADQVRDPGNLGTLLRSAAAAGAQAVLFLQGTADPFSPKVVRAGMGAHFRLPLRSLPWVEIEKICRPGLKLYLAEAEGGPPYWQANLRQPLALVIGGEAEGASAGVRASVDGLVSIPMPGKSDSLNAAIAASILLFEVVRQRSIP